MKLNGTEIFEQLKDWVLAIFWALLGVSAKLAFVVKNKKLTKLQVVVTAAFGMFGAFLANQICQYMKTNEHLRWLAIGVAALIGENIVGWIISNAETIIERILKILTKKK